MKLSVAKIEIEKPSESIDQEQLQGIVDSFREVGQSHPIIVRPAKESGLFPLVSGEKRLLAARMSEWSEIEAEVRDISEEEGHIIRLHENLRRFNLPWWEQVVLVEQLHALRQQEHGAAPRGRPKAGVDRGWSIQDTAEELSVGLGPLSEDLSLARALRVDPSLSKVKDKKTAIRLVRIASQRFQNEQESSMPTTFEANQVLFGDSTTLLQRLPPECIDHCITDPPWIKFFDSSLRLDERTLPVFKELYRVLKNNSILYLFCGLDDFHYYAGHVEPDPENPSGEKIHIQGELEKIGFTVSKTPIIWQKESFLSRRGVKPWEYARDFEFIIVAAKGNPILAASRQLSGIKSFPIVPPVKMIHSNEKPVDLIEDLLIDCSYEKNIIIDPFAGSGVLGLACKNLERKYILCERDRKYYEAICKRLKEA